MSAAVRAAPLRRNSVGHCRWPGAGVLPVLVLRMNTMETFR